MIHYLTRGTGRECCQLLKGTGFCGHRVTEGLGEKRTLRGAGKGRAWVDGTGRSGPNRPDGGAKAGRLGRPWDVNFILPFFSFSFCFFLSKSLLSLC